MAVTPPESSNTSPLGAFASLVGTLAIFLYFTGWVYRWAYFGFFEVAINSLKFPSESFLLVPIQVVLGDLGKLVWATLTALVIVGLIKTTVWLIEPLSARTSPASTRSNFSNAIVKLHRFPLFRGFRWFTSVFPQTLRRDFTVVAWILIALFWLAQWQGTEDAWRDAVNQSSTRPIVTLVSPVDKFALGAILDDEIVSDETQNPSYPALKGLSFFGDIDQFRTLYGKGSNNFSTSSPLVWRLLIKNENWLYVFPALSERKTDQRPLILAIHSGDGRIQSLILSRPKMNQ